MAVILPRGSGCGYFRRSDRITALRVRLNNLIGAAVIAAARRLGPIRSIQARDALKPAPQAFLSSSCAYVLLVRT